MGDRNLKLQFLGAARNVTGSRYLLTFPDRRLLIDCGLHQERDLRGRDWEPFPFDPATVDALLLTHPHIDHCGLIPKLVRDGFRGRILCTPPAADLCPLLLLDSAHIQEEDAAFKQKRHRKEGRPPKDIRPLYTAEDARRALSFLESVPYGQTVPLGREAEAVFHDAGHILGSAHLELRVRNNEKQRIFLFSGDIGQKDRPLLRDPSPPAEADYVIMESTYGDRQHEHAEERVERLAEAVRSTFEAGGNVVIPAFAVGRTQELLYELDRLIAAQRIPPPVVFVDSPMAVSATEIFRAHPECYDAEAAALLRAGEDPLDFVGLHLVRSVAGSQAINHVRGSCIIIAASGMCTAGRIKHHLAHNISRPECTILFIGFQAQGTLGRQLVEGQNPVRIHGQLRDVRARIESIQGFSAHADQAGLIAWLGHLRTPPRRLFLTHGEESAIAAFHRKIRETLGWESEAPTYGEEVELPP